MKRHTWIILGAAALLALAACTKESPPTAPSSTPSSAGNSGKIAPLAEITYPQTPDGNDYEAIRKYAEDSTVSPSFLQSVNRFAYQLAVQTLHAQDENRNVSPVSLYYALSLAATGAAGDTQKQLLQTLGVDNADTLAKLCAQMYRALYVDSDEATLKTANSLWMNAELSPSISYQEAFIQSAKDNFYAEVYQTPFNQPAADAMVKWIAAHTNATIQAPLDANMIQGQTLAIMNTVYFKDAWVDPFVAASTAEDTFQLADGSTVNAPFMNRTESSAQFARGEGFTRASLPFSSGSNMIFVLPDKGTDVNQQLSTADGVRTLFEGGEEKTGEVVWKVPKLSFDSSMDTLIQDLEKMGVHDAFTDKKADFSNMAYVSDTERLFIDTILQQTHLKIDEKGAEASAATEMILSTGALMQTEEKAEMLLDRPFVYGLTDRNGVLLFIGVVQDPTK